VRGHYPTPCLKHFFESFPDLMPKPKDVVDAVGKRNDHKSTGPQETVSKADDRVEGLSHLSLGTSEVYRYYALKADTLIDSGPRNCQFKAEFQCVLPRDDASVCCQIVQIFRSCSTTNISSTSRTVSTSLTRRQQRRFERAATIRLRSRMVRLCRSTVSRKRSRIRSTFFTFAPRASHRLSWRRKSFVSMFVDKMHEPASRIIARCIEVI